MTIKALASKSSPASNIRKLMGNIWRQRWLYFLMLPTLIYFAVFKYGPLWNAQIAFRDFKPLLGVVDSPWVGFKHFETFINSLETINGRLMEPMSFLNFFQSQPWVDGRGIQVILPPANAADFDRYYSEGLLQFVLGQIELNETTWAEYLAGLDSLGAADYEAAAKQALIDAGLIK